MKIPLRPKLSSTLYHYYRDRHVHHHWVSCFLLFLLCNFNVILTVATDAVVLFLLLPPILPPSYPLLLFLPQPPPPNERNEASQTPLRFISISHCLSFFSPKSFLRGPITLILIRTLLSLSSHSPTNTDPDP